jgi:hypothetical protein
MEAIWDTESLWPRFFTSSYDVMSSWCPTAGGSSFFYLTIYVVHFYLVHADMDIHKGPRPSRVRLNYVSDGDALTLDVLLGLQLDAQTALDYLLSHESLCESPIVRNLVSTCSRPDKFSSGYSDR